ncbi:MAG: T9SS type A sorting domain-containing protein [Prevotellaceae bacterium]|nr:T9SS type A sorting domain-containing protein [Prevotellaceae bacterium]
MKIKLLSLLVLFNILGINISYVSGSTWKNYLSYNDITDVKEGNNTLYVLASGALFSYNTNDMSITTYDKATNLSDCNIKIIEWCQSAKSLIIVYSNGNIDILSSSGTVTNLSDYYNKTMTDDKTVYRIDVIGQYAYMSTGFGVVKINVSRAEISDTYNLGFRVDYCYISNNTIYAASSTNGIYAASLSSNLLDSSNWSYYSSYVSNDKTVDEELLAQAETLNPGGPKYNYFNYMYFKNNRLYTSGGGWTTGATYERPGCVQVLNNSEWNIYQDDFTLLHNVSYLDASAIAVDPNDADHVFVGTIHGGIIEFQDGSYVNNYTYDNSMLRSAVTGLADYVRVDGLVYDNNGSLFMLNSESENAIVEYTSDGEWVAHNPSGLFSGSVSLGIMRQSILDSRGYIWFVNDHMAKPALFCYEPDSENLTEFTDFINQNGSTISTYGATCVAEDIDNNIWVGTESGPLMLTSSQMADPSLGFTQVIVPRNDGTDYGDYLLSGVDITAIAVDGAGRKWFGTNGNGVYLISEDNMTQEQHFLAAETPLLSDVIESIAINGETGEVYFGTDEGLCSYMGDATSTNTEMTKDNVYAYPNPVKPDYTGNITVVGLTLNADVKIVTSNGALVASGKSTGGSFTWDGCDLNGKRVASGVYMVQTATSSGEKGTVCKIAIVN